MVVHLEFLLNDTGQNRRGPDPGVQSISDRTAFNNVVKLLKLDPGHLAGASAAMALLDAFLAMLIPVAHPSVNAGAMNVQESGNLWRGVSVGAEQKGLKAQGNARSLVGLSFLAQGQKFAAGAGVGLGNDRFHGNACRITYARILR
jgi:hypothetical protein